MHFRQPSFLRRISHAIASVVLTGAVLSASAQTTPPNRPPDTRPLKTFYLNSGTSINDSNEVLTAVRLLLEPDTKLYLMASENALLVRGTPAQIELAGKVIAATNRPKLSYRVTYTLTEMDGGKRVGVQHYVLLMSPGARTDLKQGSKVPIVTGSIANSNGGSPNTQFTFVDVGINVDATLHLSADGLTLQNKMEQSGVIEDKSIAGVSEPIIRQTVLEGTALLQPGKPVALGSLDVPGSTRHLDVEVLLEPMR